MGPRRKPAPPHLLLAALGLVALLGWTEAAFPYTAKQAHLGHKIFALNCTVCHGEDGRGGTVPRGAMMGHKTPPLLGTDTFPLQPRPDQKYRKIPFQAAYDIYRFLNGKHPPGTPKLYFEEDFWAIIALFLEGRGLGPDGVSLTPEVAQRTPLHPAGGGQKAP